MRTIEIFSVYKIDSFIKKWRKAFPTLSIQKVDEPTSNCYVLFKYDTNKTMRFPFEAIHGAHKVHRRLDKGMQSPENTSARRA